MDTTTIIQLFVFVGYVSFITIKFGILPSISDSWYHETFKQKILFWLFCAIIGATMVIKQELLFVVSGVGIGITGVMAAFKSDIKAVAVLHSVGAYTSILAALAGQCIYEHEFYSPAAFIVLFAWINTLKVNNRTFWIEVAAFICIIFGFLIK